MVSFVKFVVYLVLIVVALHFIHACLFLIPQPKQIQTDIDLSKNLTPMLSNGTGLEEIERNEILKELKDYGQQMITKSNEESKNLTNTIKHQYLIRKQQSLPNTNTEIWSKLLKYVSPSNVSNDKETPELENFHDYAPKIDFDQLQSDNFKKVFPNVKTDPSKDNLLLGDQIINGYDSWNGLKPSEKISDYFVNKTLNGNLSKCFDDICKNDLIDPSEWESKQFKSNN